MKLNRAYVPAFIIIFLIAFFAIIDQPEICLILFSIGVVHLLFTDSKVTLLLIVIVSSLFFTMLSSILIESGAYITEQFRYGYRNNATSFLSLYSFSIIVTAHIVMRSLISNEEKPVILLSRSISSQRTRLTYTHFYFFLFLLSLIFLMIIITYGSASLQGEGRFAFWNRIPVWVSTVIKYIRALVGPIGCICGYIFMQISRRDKKLVLFLMSTIFIQLFLAGDKLSPFFGFLTFFTMGFVFYKIKQREQIVVSGKGLFVLLLAAILLMVTIFLGFILQHNLTLDMAYTAFFSRLTLQGHVWFGVFEVVSKSGAALSVEDFIYPNSFNNPTGLDKLSYLVSNFNFVSERISRGLTFTMGGPAAALSVGGLFWGLIIYSAFGLIYPLVVYYVYRKLIRLQFVRAGVALLFIVSLHSIILMGNWYSIYNVASILFFIILIIDLSLRFKSARIGKIKI